MELDPTSYEAHLDYAYALDGQKGRDPKKGARRGRGLREGARAQPDQPDAICGAGWAYAAEKTGWDKALGFLERCKALATTTPKDQQLIDAKLQGIAGDAEERAAAGRCRAEEGEAQGQRRRHVAARQGVATRRRRQPGGVPARRAAARASACRLRACADARLPARRCPE